MAQNAADKPKKWWLDILYEDENILLVNKPVGMIVHPNQSVQSDSLLKYVREYLYKTGSWNAKDSSAFRPMPCNRLDRFTGGIVIFAKTWEAMREINAQLQQHTIEKKYYCIVIGELQPPCGRIKNYILKNKDDTFVTVCEEKNKNAELAITDYRTVAGRDGLSLVDCDLITGRMHQLRAQFANKGAPILGDMTYGNKKENKLRHQEYQLLFAYKVVFHFPDTSCVLGYLDGKSVSVKKVPFLQKYIPDINKYLNAKHQEVTKLKRTEFLLCPVCHNKTRIKVLPDTVIERFPLFCPKCKHETLISVKKQNIKILIEPDAMTQSR